MFPDLHFYPPFDHCETGTRMTDPKVVHPATQNRIDFRNHIFDGPADMLAEDLPELFKQRCSLLQLGRIVWPPLPLKTHYTPIFKTHESEALSLLQVYHPALLLIDLNSELRELLAQPSIYRLHQPVTPPFSVDKITRSSATRTYWTLVDLKLRVVSPAFSSIRSTSFR